MPSLRPWVAYALVALATLAVCSPLLDTAFFGLDDHRYLRELRDIRVGEPGALARSLVVENRWDEHWWIPEGTFVRFFRPLVIAAYAFDAWLWGLNPLGFVATNVALHLGATFLVMAFCARLVGWGGGALIAGLAFGTQLAHFENLFYIPGRTTTLAAIAFVAALWLHLRTREHTSPGRQITVALLCFAAFLGKESTALLPVFLVLLDLWVPPPETRPGLRTVLRRQATMLAACVVLGALYLLLRSMALGTDAGSSPYPYLHLPDRERFAERTLAVWLQYSSSLSVGTFIQTFLEVPRQLYGRVGWVELLVGALWVPALCVFGFRSGGRGRWLATLLLLGVLPFLPLYSAARHVYIASVGYCGLLGLLTQRALASPRRAARVALVAGIAVFVALPAVRLYELLDTHPRDLTLVDAAGRPRSPGSIYAQLFTGGDLRPHADRPLYLLDFPGGWYEMQFVADALEVELDADMPPLRVLAPRLSWPGHHDRPVQVRRIDDSTIEIDRGGLTLIDPGGGGFDKKTLAPGDVVRRPGYQLQVIEAHKGRPQRARIRFDRPLEGIDLGQFVRADGWNLHRVRI